MRRTLATHGFRCRFPVIICRRKYRGGPRADAQRRFPTIASALDPHRERRRVAPRAPASALDPSARRNRTFRSVRGKSEHSLDSTLTLLSEIAPRFPSTSAQFGARKTAPARARSAVVVRAAQMNVKDLKPTGNRVLVIADPAETTTAGGILLASAETAKGPGSSVTGKVASVGAEVKGVKAGDKVLINGFSGADVEFADGEQGKFITVDDVIAIIS